MYNYKKPITHKMLTKNVNYFRQLCIVTIVIGHLAAFMHHIVDAVDTSTWASFFVVHGLFFAIWAYSVYYIVQKQRKLNSSDYYIYIDTVMLKETAQSGGGPESSSHTEYYIRFDRNSYKKRVDLNEYQRTHVGDKYYLIQPVGEGHAVAAFSEREYFLDYSIMDKFRPI